MRNALRGESAAIDFVRQNNSFRDQWEDTKDFFSGNTYTQGGIFGGKSLSFGATSTLGEYGHRSEFSANTRHSFKQIDGSSPDVQLFGQNAKGDNILTISFQTQDDSKDDILRYTSTVDGISKLLEGTGRSLKSRTTTKKYTQGDKEWEEEETSYWIE